MGTIRPSLPAALLCVLAFVTGCPTAVTTPDASTAPDAATPDAATPDAATPDAAATRDAGTDAAPRRDAGPAPPGCPETFGGCVDFEDHRGEATVTIDFDPAGALAYTPNCIRVSAGTQVTVPGSAVHPLVGAPCSPAATPLAPTSMPSTTDYTFGTPGTYGYYCNFHGAPTGEGMAGLVLVY